MHSPFISASADAADRARKHSCLTATPAGSCTGALRRGLPTGHRSRPFRRGTCPALALAHRCAAQDETGCSRRIGSVQKGSAVSGRRPATLAEGIMDDSAHDRSTRCMPERIDIRGWRCWGREDKLRIMRVSLAPNAIVSAVDPMAPAGPRGADPGGLHWYGVTIWMRAWVKPAAVAEELA
jgi:hypothetical protein